MKLTVKTLTGKSLNLEIESSDLVSLLKQKIHTIGGIPAERQTLICGGKALIDDYKTLLDYNISRDSTVYLILDRGQKQEIGYQSESPTVQRCGNWFGIQPTGLFTTMSGPQIVFDFVRPGSATPTGQQRFEFVFFG